MFSGRSQVTYFITCFVVKKIKKRFDSFLSTCYYVYKFQNKFTLKREVRVDEMHREPRQLRRGQGCYPENGLRVSGRRTLFLEP